MGACLFFIAHGSRRYYAVIVNKAQLERMLVKQLRELYWRPYLYHKLGRDLLELQKLDGENRPHWNHGDHRLRDLAKEAGAPLGNKKRAPSLCYLAVQLARDIPYKDLVWYRERGLEWDQVRRMLAALGTGRSRAERNEARVAIRARVVEFGSDGFTDFIKTIAPARRTNNFEARKGAPTEQTKRSKA